MAGSSSLPRGTPYAFFIQCLSYVSRANSFGMKPRPMGRDREIVRSDCENLRAQTAVHPSVACRGGVSFSRRFGSKFDRY